MFFYGPDWTIESDIVSRAQVSAAPIPLAELLEVVGRWPTMAAEVAARVTVPVQYTAFEFERLWCIDADSVPVFAGYFTASPAVSSELMPGIGHDADHHRNSQAFHLRQLSFVLDCAHRTAAPVRPRRRRRPLDRLPAAEIQQVIPDAVGPARRRFPAYHGRGAGRTA